MRDLTLPSRGDRFLPPSVSRVNLLGIVLLGFAWGVDALTIPSSIFSRQNAGIGRGALTSAEAHAGQSALVGLTKRERVTLHAIEAASHTEASELARLLERFPSQDSVFDLGATIGHDTMHELKPKFGPQSANQTLIALKYGIGHEAIRTFQQDFRLLTTGALDSPTMTELQSMQDLLTPTLASDNQYLVAAVSVVREVPDKHYRVIIPWGKPQFFDTAREIGEYLAIAAKERAVKISYLIPRMSEKESSALRVSMNQQSRAVTAYVMTEGIGALESVRISLLNPRGVVQVKFSTTVPRQALRNGKIIFQSKVRLKINDSQLAARVVASTKKAIKYFIQRLQYYFAKLDGATSIAAAIHHAKSDTLKAYNMTADQLTVEFVDSAKNIQIAMLPEYYYYLAEKH